MQFAQTTHQITAEEIEVRDIGQLYVRITQNTEFLTNIIRYQHTRAYTPFNIEIQSIELRSFYNLIVQSCYLLYTCYVKKVVLFLSNKLFVSFEKEAGVEVIMEFILEKQFLRLDQKKKQHILNNFKYINIFRHENAYAEQVLSLIKEFLKFIREYIKKQKDRKVISDKDQMRQLESLESAYILLSSEAQKGIKPKQFITCLEQTQIFRACSFLLKTLNCSLYESIRRTERFNEILVEVKNRQTAFCENYNMILRQNLQQHEFLQNSIEEFINFLIQRKVIEHDISIKSRHNDTIKDKSQSKIGAYQFFKFGSVSEKVYTWKIMIEEKKVRENGDKNMLGITEGEGSTVISADNADISNKVYNLLQIQFVASRKMLQVVFISNIQVNIQNSDILMFHCNNMMLQLNNVTVESVQRQSTKNRRKQRVLAFKICSNLTPKDNPFINIMLTIDRALIYGKVCEPEILKKVARIEDYSPFTVLSERINHLSNFFIKKVRRLYETAANHYNRE